MAISNIMILLTELIEKLLDVVMGTVRRAHETRYARKKADVKVYEIQRILNNKKLIAHLLVVPSV